MKTLENLGNADNLEKHQTFDFTFSNLNEIFPKGTTSQSVSFELSSPEIKYGAATNDVYNVEVVKYGIDVDYTTFNLNDSKVQSTPKEPVFIPTDKVETTPSIDEQMLQQAKEAEKKHVEAKELERQAQ